MAYSRLIMEELVETLGIGLKARAGTISIVASGAGLLAFCLTVALCALWWRIAKAQPTPALTPDVSTPVNDFGFRLLRRLTDGNGANVIVSPLSLWGALAMTYNGASGTTRTAIAKTLGIASLSDEDFNRNNRLLFNTVEKGDPAVQIEIANALWPQSDFTINPDFLRLGHEFFDASVEGLNFAGDPRQAADHINAWVKEKTHGKIPEIIKRLARNTVLVLTDAVYFKGRWSVPFDKKRTEPRAFHLSGGGSVVAPMMVQNGEYDYLETGSFQAIRLPYGNNRFAMYVFLPRKSIGLPDFLRSLDESQWNRWIAQLSTRKGRIVLPRLESTYGRQLNDALMAMGMGIAFGRNADFSRIHPPPPPLRIDDVEHKTYVKVDEEGTEAAAATSVGIVALAISSRPPPFEMVVDHPFFCAIAEKQSGVLLFAGVVTDPMQR
jgi:serine protease inhibitor